MGRLDWDRLRRTRPLDGAELRVDPDGEQLWEQAKEEYVPFGARRLRRGVIVRAKETTPSSTERATRCSRCGAEIAPRKVVLHASRCPARSPSSQGSKSVPK